MVDIDQISEIPQENKLEDEQLPKAPEPDSSMKAFTPSNWQGNSNLKEIIESYLRYYAHGDSHTAKAKRYDLSYFLEFLAGSRKNVNEVSITQWTMQSTKDFIDYRISIGESPATVSRRLATVKHFGRTLAERLKGFINPAREVKSPTLQITKPNGLAGDEIELLLLAVRGDEWLQDSSFITVRNRLLVELLLCTGLRADEVRLLVTGQISEDLSWLKNVKTKGRKYRNVYLDSAVRPLLKEYLLKREEEISRTFPEIISLDLSERSRYPVFVSVHGAKFGNPMSFGLAPKTVWRIISNFGRKAQSLANKSIGALHPHKLRHTFAHGLLDTSKDIRLVAQALGHSDVRTTMRYTERTEEQIANAVEASKLLKQSICQN